jgi:hypothetical protein
MKENALKRVNSLFTWAQVSQSVSRCYESIVQPAYASADMANNANRKTQAA